MGLVLTQAQQGVRLPLLPKAALAQEGERENTNSGSVWPPLQALTRFECPEGPGGHSCYKQGLLLWLPMGEASANTWECFHFK